MMATLWLRVARLQARCSGPAYLLGSPFWGHHCGARARGPRSRWGKKLLAALINDAQHRLAQREAEVDALAGEGAMRTLERDVILDAIDRKWREHLYEMDYLKAGIGLRALAERDPLVEYHREGYDMFIAMLDGVKEDCIRSLFHTAVQATPAAPVVPATAPPMTLTEPAALAATATHAAAHRDGDTQRYTAASR